MACLVNRNGKPHTTQPSKRRLRQERAAKRLGFSSPEQFAEARKAEAARKGAKPESKV